MLKSEVLSGPCFCRVRICPDENLQFVWSKRKAFLQISLCTSASSPGNRDFFPGEEVDVHQSLFYFASNCFHTLNTAFYSESSANFL